MYTIEERVKMSEIDKKMVWTIPSIIDSMQDCIMFQLQDLGLGFDYMKKEGKSLIVTSWQVKIFKLPKLFDKIKISTQVYGFKNATALRHCMVYGPDGQLAVASNSMGVFLNNETGRPMKIEKDLWEKYDMDPITPCSGLDFDVRHISLPEGCHQVEDFHVNIHHLDINNHMNNAQYVRIASNYLPDDFLVKDFRIEYKTSARLGSHVKVLRCINQQRTLCTISFCDPEGKPYAIAEFASAI